MPDGAATDRGELECVGPNPSVVDNPGSYCTQNCTDVFHMLVCIDGEWQCPVPNPVLVRDCVWGERGEVGVLDYGPGDAGELEEGDAGAEPGD